MSRDETSRAVLKSLFIDSGAFTAYTKGISIDIDEYICSLDINRFIDKYPAQLSGGEKNRVSLIFCIIKNTPIIILDEPTAALDSYYTNKVRNIIKKESKNHLFIISTHDHELYEIADKFTETVCVETVEELDLDK